MDITIQSPDFKSDSELNEFIKEKVKKLSRFFDKIESANVHLKLDNTGDTVRKICEIRLAVPGNDLFAERRCKTFEEATSEVVDVLQIQLQKLKSKSEAY